MLPEKALSFWDPSRRRESTSRPGKEAPAFRWAKMYKGVRSRITYEKLDVPSFMTEAAYKLANAWRERKLADLKRSDPTTELPSRYQRADLEEAIQKGEASKRMLEMLLIGEMARPPATAPENGYNGV